jgi:hypothetical protein
MDEYGVEDTGRETGGGKLLLTSCGIQDRVEVLLKSVSSLWTIPPEASSVTSRDPVRFNSCIIMSWTWQMDKQEGIYALEREYIYWENEADTF